MSQTFDPQFYGRMVRFGPWFPSHRRRAKRITHKQARAHARRELAVLEV